MPRVQPIGASRDLPETRKAVGFPEGFWTDEWTEEQRADWGGKADSRRAKKAQRKPSYQESLEFAGRLGARLKKLEKKDLPR